MSGASKEDLEQDVVEEKGAEHAAQLLALLDVPEGERLAEIVLVCLLQPSHVHTALQLAPDNKFSKTSGFRTQSRPTNALSSWCPSPSNFQ